MSLFHYKNFRSRRVNGGKVGQVRPISELFVIEDELRQSSSSMSMMTGEDIKINVKGIEGLLKMAEPMILMSKIQKF